MIKKLPEEFSHIVTEREIFNREYVVRWKACLEIAKILYPDDILTVTGQLFLGWVIGTDDIRSKKKSLQTQLGKLQDEIKPLRRKKKIDDSKPF